MIWDLLFIIFIAASIVRITVGQMCRRNEFQCANGECVNYSGKCDGKADCSDGSDEARWICSNPLPTFGDCLLPPYPANGTYEVDGDPTAYPGIKFSVVTLRVFCDPGFAVEEETNVVRCFRGRWLSSMRHCKRPVSLQLRTYPDQTVRNAKNGDDIVSVCRDEGPNRAPVRWVREGGLPMKQGYVDRKGRLELDGVTTADSGVYICQATAYLGQPGSEVKVYLKVEDPTSNETVPCRDDQWECSDGFCIPIEDKCNGIDDCPYASDETYFTCRNVRKGGCVLPEYPPNGVYEVEGDPIAVPGKRYRTAALITVSCDPGYAVNGNNQSFCYRTGFSYIPQCTRYCVLEKLRGVDYTCVTQNGATQSRSPCSDMVFVGTTVEPSCAAPNYYGDLSHMHCKEDGQWTYIAKCMPECGKVTPKGKPNIINGTRARHGDLPWHAGIYRKTAMPYQQICGGSLANTKAVISAAHCFWQDGVGKRPPENYAVTLGKIYRPWNDSHDEETQRSDVSEIHIPTEYRGAQINFQYDIAVVTLVTEIVYQTFVRPVCINFDDNFNAAQLQDGNLGKIAGWGLTGIDGKPSQVLKVVDLPYVSFDVCFDESPDYFREYITGDKFCAGYRNGTALCEGDSGGGLAFPAVVHGTQRYYLRGVVSTAPGSDFHACNPNVRSTFTRIFTHERFIKNYVTLE